MVISLHIWIILFTKSLFFSKNNNSKKQSQIFIFNANNLFSSSYRLWLRFGLGSSECYRFKAVLDKFEIYFKKKIITMELRKQRERELHNLLRDKELLSSRDFEYYTSNKKWYSIVRSSRTFFEKWLIKKTPHKRVLDYCCGNGSFSLRIAKIRTTEVIGIDISNISIENARKSTVKERADNKIRFLIMDAENMKFDSGTFDIIYEAGALHHLNLERAYSEIARVLKPDGECICMEALGNNPIIHYYRKRTPHLRTEWEVEHILGKKDIERARLFFNKIEILRFFHLATIPAVLFRNFPGFNTLLSALEVLDKVLLKLPILKWQAWQVIFVLSKPIKNSKR